VRNVLRRRLKAGDIGLAGPLDQGMARFVFGHLGLHALPNGSRLSCGRNARGRKAAERQTKRLAGEATQFLPTL